MGYVICDCVCNMFYKAKTIKSLLKLLNIELKNEI